VDVRLTAAADFRPAIGRSRPLAPVSSVPRRIDDIRLNGTKAAGANSPPRQVERFNSEESAVYLDTCQQKQTPPKLNRYK